MDWLHKKYGKHFQDRVPADSPYAAADVLRTLLRWPEWNVPGAGVCRRHELRLLLLFRQNRAGHVSRQASDPRRASACLRSRRTLDPENRHSHAEDVRDSDRVAERL